MLKREIKYTDFDGNEASDTHYFNITKSEIVELEVSKDGGMEAFIRRIAETNDHKSLIAEFKRLILLAYGVKSEDGKRFVKNDQIREDFSQTLAYDALFMELATDDEAAATFIKGILPADVAGKLDEMNTKLPPPNIVPAETLRGPVDTTATDTP